MKKKKFWILALVIVVLVGAFFLIWKLSAPKANVGDKTISVSITHLDGTVVNKELNTDADNLWDAMTEAKLIEGKDSEYGKWITAVDGETADESAGQYWMFTRSGEWVDTACDSTLIADGESYEFFVYVG